MNLIIDGVEIITIWQAHEAKQNYAPVTNGTLLRMMDGTAVKQKVWSKTATNITGSGWVPDGLSNIDFDGQVVVDCIAEKSITSLSNVIVVPGVVRPDFDPFGMAYINGNWENAGSTFLTGTLTIDVTAGATLYQARWLPRLTLYCDEPETETDISGANFGWSISGEEV